MTSQLCISESVYPRRQFVPKAPGHINSLLKENSKKESMNESKLIGRNDHEDRGRQCLEPCQVNNRAEIQHHSI